MKRRPPSSTLFPYPALSRSEPASGMPPSGGPASGGPASGGPASGGPASGIGASTSNPSTRVLVLPRGSVTATSRSEEHTSELQSQSNLVCRLLLEKKKYNGQLFLPNPVTITVFFIEPALAGMSKVTHFQFHLFSIEPIVPFMRTHITCVLVIFQLA